MKYALLDEAKKVVPNPDILINLISKRVKQLRNGSEPLVHSLEKLSLEDVSWREVIEHKITSDL